MIVYQENIGGIIALLPDGRVEFLHPQVKSELIKLQKGTIESVDFDDYIINNPYVELNNFHLSGPLIGFIEITNLCNLTCTHCYAFSGKKRKEELSTERIFELIDEFERIGTLQLFLTGGEVFAHKDAIEIINYALTKKFVLQIFTNGTLITEERLKRINSSASFFISFDTADPERTIRGKMNFPKLKTAFELLKQYGHSFRTAISVHSNNVKDAEEIFEWCADNNYPRPQWLETHPIGRALFNKHILLDETRLDEVFSVYKRCMDLYSVEESESESENSYSDTIAPNNFYSIDTIKFCQRLEQATGYEKCGRSVVYIASDGNVYPCSNCMSNSSYVAGNLNNDSLKNIWEQGFDAFRKISFNDYENCKSCAVNHEGIWCQFRCPPLARNVSGNELGCGATDYLKKFMLVSNRYWEERREKNIKLVLNQFKS